MTTKEFKQVTKKAFAIEITVIVSVCLVVPVAVFYLFYLGSIGRIS